MSDVSYATSIDIGATKVLCALVSAKGEIIFTKREPTARKDARSLVSQVASLIRNVDSLSGIDEYRIKGVGIAVPGIVDSSNGFVVWAPNLVGWRDLPLRKLLRKDFGIKKPIFVDDDRVASVLGEQWLGAARGSRNVVYIIIGTGIGAGILIDGKPYKGNMVAGAIGWMLLGEEFMYQTYDKGCLESLASGPNIALRTIEALRKGAETNMLAMVNGKADRITSEIVFEAARKGDKLALDIVKKTARCLGIAVSNILSILGPDVVVLGGGVGEASDLILDDIKHIVNSYTQPYTAKTVKIVPSALGGNASALGAAKLVFNDLKTIF